VGYILQQRLHHGLPLDPRAEAGSAADLLGLRTLGLYTVLNVRRWLPRLRRRDGLRKRPTDPALVLALRLQRGLGQVTARAQAAGLRP
jgi:hypothetical protein